MTCKYTSSAQKAEKAKQQTQLLTKHAELSAAAERGSCGFKSAQIARQTEYDLRIPSRSAGAPKIIRRR